MFALITAGCDQRQAEVSSATPSMAHTSLSRPRQHSLLEQLKQTGRWLLDGAGQALGFQAPQDHPEPPAVGPQPYSGVARRHLRRGQRH